MGNYLIAFTLVAALATFIALVVLVRGSRAALRDIYAELAALRAVLEALPLPPPSIHTPLKPGEKRYLGRHGEVLIRAAPPASSEIPIPPSGFHDRGEDL